MSPLRHVLGALVLTLVGAGGASAQSPARPPAAVEGTLGHAAFLDEDPVDHFVLGAGYRHPLTPRVSIGPEFQFMTGPHEDRDYFLTGNLWVDLAPPRAGRRAAPYLVAGGGIMIQHPEFDFLGGPYKEGAATGGIGVRIAVGDRWYIAPEARLGWEAHSRLTVTAGYRVRR